MAIFRINFFGHTAQARKYSYKPRYYDPNREELEEIYKKYGKTPDWKKGKDGEVASEVVEEPVKKPYVPGVNIRGAFQRNIEEQRAADKGSTMKKVMSVITAILIVAVLYFLIDGFSAMLNK